MLLIFFLWWLFEPTLSTVYGVCGASSLEGGRLMLTFIHIYFCDRQLVLSCRIVYVSLSVLFVLCCFFVFCFDSVIVVLSRRSRAPSSSPPKKTTYDRGLQHQPRYSSKVRGGESPTPEVVRHARFVVFV